jgi:hypothetical protein
MHISNELITIVVMTLAIFTIAIGVGMLMYAKK